MLVHCLAGETAPGYKRDGKGREEVCFCTERAGHQASQRNAQGAAERGGGSGFSVDTGVSRAEALGSMLGCGSSGVVSAAGLGAVAVLVASARNAAADRARVIS